MLPLTKEKLKSHQDAKVCDICRNYIANEITVFFHNDSSYDYHFITKN